MRVECVTETAWPSRCRPLVSLLKIPLKRLPMPTVSVQMPKPDQKKVYPGRTPAIGAKAGIQYPQRQGGNLKRWLRGLEPPTLELQSREHGF